MATRVLVIASDTLPLPGLPTSGGGLRSWQFIQGLKANGFEVVASMPLFTYLSEKYRDRIPADVRRLGWTFENQDDLVDEVRPDVVIFMNAETYALRRHRLPTVFDLAGPRLLEAQYLGVPDQARRIARKIENLRVPDLITCAGPSQRFYFLSFLLQTGIAIEDIRIDVVPVSLSPSLPERLSAGDVPTFVFGGGFFPWQDSSVALCTVAEYLGKRGRGCLHIYGASHGIEPKSEKGFAELRNALERRSGVTFLGYVPHEELIGHYCAATAAVDLMARNFERELAFTTRTVLYLWCGLPVIYNNYSDLSRYIEKYRAGWCLDPTDVAALERVLDEIFEEPQRVAEYSRNARRLVREELDWTKTIRPVVEFCREPRVRPKLYYERVGAAWAGWDSDAQALSRRLAEIEATLGWQALVRLRAWVHRLCPPSTRRGRFVQLVLLGLRTGARIGWWRTIGKAFTQPRRTWHRLRSRSHFTLDKQYRQWLARERLTAERRRMMANEVESWGYRPLVSVVVPVYNTDERWLRACLESVRRQLYPRWELCIADDGSTGSHVRRILEEYAADPRVKVTYLPRNAGISVASNAALALATGEFVGFLDHDDELTEDALWEVVKKLNENPSVDLVYSDEDMLREDGLREGPIFKPQWSPDLLLSFNYITHFCVVRRSVLHAVKGFRPGFEGAQDYDLFLRVTERTQAIAHIPKPLYSWRRAAGSTARRPGAKPYAHEAGRRAVEEAVRRRGNCGAFVEDGLASRYRYRVRYPIDGEPLVSIVVPSWGRSDNELAHWIRRLAKGTAYGGLELILVTDLAKAPAAGSLLVRVVPCPTSRCIGSALNEGVRAANGSYLVFVNDDICPLVSDWLEAMLEQAQREEVGAVGGKILRTDETIESAGLVLRPDGMVGHAFQGHPGRDPVYYDFPNVIRNWSAVSGNCLMLRRSLFERLGGFAEELSERFGDVDLCLRLEVAGYRTVYTPYALVTHTGDGICWRYDGEAPSAFQKRWKARLAAGDPFYNPNLSLEVFDHLSLRF